ncbi:MAG: SAM-dependent chlorinase/fluorinase [Acidimicrobiia bacterium]|nr:SAM-dependent chlorinase/fluorinase [Acidimicrobiia bacterium]
MGRYDTISFLTDYGTTDEFVGVCHSVIRSIAPDVAVIDVTHQIPRHDVRAGGLALARSAQYLAPGVVVAVVDPGVGTERRPIAVEVGDGASVLVGPDNGLLAPAVALVGGATAAVVLDQHEYHLPALGPTFDGRDLFSPVAAHLCNGVPLAAVGTPIDPASLLPSVIPVSEGTADGVVGEVLWVDHFGNGQVNIDPADIDGWGDRLRLVIDGDVRVIDRVRSFADIAPGGLGLLIDSYGMLAIAVDRGSAAAELGLDGGVELRLEPVGDHEPDPGATSPVSLRARRES